MTVVGGLRARFLQDSLRLVIEEGLTTLGWFDANRTHKPLRFLAGPHDWDQPVGFNSMVVTTRSRSTQDFEVGSHLTEDVARVTVDIYVEDDSLALDLANDIRDTIRGRMPFGPVNGTFPILDLRMATPQALGYAHIGEVRMTRVVPPPTSAYSLFWFGVDTDIYDYYYDSSDPALPLAGFPYTGLFPSDDLFPVGGPIPHSGLFPADDLFPVGASGPGTGQFPADDLFPGQ